MRAVVQRVTSADVTVGGRIVGAVGAGMLVLLGVAHDDEPDDADHLARKIARLRIFESSAGKLDLSLVDIRGEALVVSQFTLLADTEKGNRPSFTGAARSELARPLVERFSASMAAEGVTVATGAFGERMRVALVNDGPVTIILG